MEFDIKAVEINGVPLVILGVPITETYLVTWYVMIALIVFAIVATRNMKEVPTGVQNIAELIVETVNGLVKSTMGERHMHFAPYIGTVFMFVLLCNLSGMLGFRPPTADLNTTFALSMLTFFMVQYGKITTLKGNYIKSYFEPIAILFPINIIGDVALPISLAFRLFGNLTGGMIIMALIYSALGWFAVIPITSVLHIYFDLFSSVLQSFIFVMLTMVFVSGAYGD